MSDGGSTTQNKTILINIKRKIGLKTFTDYLIWNPIVHVICIKGKDNPEQSVRKPDKCHITRRMWVGGMETLLLKVQPSIFLQ